MQRYIITQVNGNFIFIVVVLQNTSHQVSRSGLTPSQDTVYSPNTTDSGFMCVSAVLLHERVPAGQILVSAGAVNGGTG